jgi:2-methylcitrate dehydratase PrpD
MQSPAWVAAVILADAAWSLDQVSAGRRSDAGIAGLAHRVAVVRDDTLPPAGASIAVTLTDGASRAASRDEPLGSPARPLTRDDVVAKLADAAAGLGWHDRTEAIVAAVDGLPTAPSITPLLRLLARPERNTR